MQPTVVLTLFGEEYIIPHSPKPVKKERIQKAPAPIAKKPRKKLKVVEGDVLEGWKSDKQYHSIGEVATLFNANVSLIRFWTIEFELKVRTTAKGNRLYTVENIFELRSIYRLVKQLGYKLNGAKAKIKEDKKRTLERVNLELSLRKLKKQLNQIRKSLQ
ncbi:MAG: MerR family transcriptional regulator [Bacteroidetes bacterium]|nr:MerR family transcriptional regulator [Bacteroidota bacterium]MBS1739550.1 MerR family transcriptional regulator [Bacteroidota bacterium]MBS1777451.1 MerR family transcriptional regulator [Bacteroidota bacterium]